MSRGSSLIVATILCLLLSLNATWAESGKPAAMPSDLSACIAELKKTLPADTLNRLKTGQESVVFQLNSTLGTSIRNKWLWGKSTSPLSKSFAKLGVTNPDDISSIILTSLWRDLHKQPQKVDEQVAKIKAFRFYNAPQVTQKRQIPPALWNTHLTLASGKETIKLQNWKGKVFIILIAFRDYHSIEAVQAMNSLKAQYGKQGLEIIALLHLKMTPHTVVRQEWKDSFMDAAKPTIPVVLDPPDNFVSQLGDALIGPGILSFPSTILIGSDGAMITRFNSWDAKVIEPLLKQDIEKALRNKQPSAR